MTKGPTQAPDWRVTVAPAQERNREAEYHLLEWLLSLRRRAKEQKAA